MADEALRELIEEEAALHRWTGEGGSPQDPFGRMARIQAQLEGYRQRSQRPKNLQHAERGLATWPGFHAANGRKVQPPRVRQHYIAFEDHTRPHERGFGFYIVKVPAWDYGQMIRASHPTAARLARSRTQYGESELHFLRAIDTPALD
jgi:hypothetical protein